MDKDFEFPSPYGYELIMDLDECDTTKFNREDLEAYFVDLCDLIDMEKCDVYFWDDLDTPEEDKQTSPLTTGTSAICFILTSSIVVHTLDLVGKVYINIFSCKDFDPDIAQNFTENWFSSKPCKPTFIARM